ncbi:MAG: hypothetical protein ACTHM1_07770 [Solirubrobacteraceae bacterium]
MAALTDIRLCLPQHGPIVDVCADEANERYEAFINTQRGSLVAIQERILAPSRLFPALPAGSVVERDSFRMATRRSEQLDDKARAVEFFRNS